MDELLQRLKQRKIVQWALAYVAAAFALIQVLDIVAQRFGWPEQTVRLIIILLAIGFFVTLVLAWYHGEKGAQRITGTELLFLALLLAIGGAVAWQLAPTATGQAAVSNATIAVKSPPTADRKSIAVLPFENLSDEKANAYFAEGIQDEILTRLAKIGALKVISRTSTQQFASKPGNLTDIARQLGVANIMEGSVQKAGTTVRVTVQLIKAESDEHVWAETYDRRLDDILGVESEIAQAIATALQVKLSEGEKASVAAIPTKNAQAYDAYLRGLIVEAQILPGTGDLLFRAAALYEEAVRLDPDFALAWAHLSMMKSWINMGVDHSPEVVAAAKEAVDTALRLQPDLGEAYLALGYYHYRGLLDYEGGLAAFEQARQRLPNNPDVLEAMSFIERRQGKWHEAIAHQAEAVRLDPKSTSKLASLAETYAALRDYAHARTVYDSAIALQPGTPHWALLKARTYLNEGDLESASRLLAGLPLTFVDQAQIDLLFKQRRLTDAVAALREIVAKPESHGVDFLPQAQMSLGWAQKLAGDEAEARATFLQVAQGLKAAAKPGADDAFFAAPLALTYAGLGEKEQALHYASRFLELWRNDAFMRPQAEVVAEVIHTQCGDIDAAITAIPHLLEVPNGLTLGDLRFDPMWDPLRKDPRFQNFITNTDTTTRNQGHSLSDKRH